MRSLIVVALAGAALVTAVVGHGAIVPNVSIAGAKIGMTEAQLKGALGPPQSIRRGTPSTEVAYPKVTAVLLKGKVAGLTTKSPAEKVAGIGVGSSEKKLRQQVKRLRCVVNFGTRVCNLLRPGHKAGQAFTEFFVDKGKVSRISIRTGDPLTQS